MRQRKYLTFLGCDGGWVTAQVQFCECRLEEPLVCDDELVTAPVLKTAVGQVPADDDGDLPAPVGYSQQQSH